MKIFNNKLTLKYQKSHIIQQILVSHETLPKTRSLIFNLGAIKNPNKKFDDLNSLNFFIHISHHMPSNLCTHVNARQALHTTIK